MGKIIFLSVVVILGLILILFVFSNIEDVSDEVNNYVDEKPVNNILETSTSLK